MAELEKILAALDQSGLSGLSGLSGQPGRSEQAESVLRLLYGNDPQVISNQKSRYIKAITRFCEEFPMLAAKSDIDISIFSTPGRTEVGGNHTDHNAGRVLAAAVDLDAIAITAKNDTGIITVRSEGHDTDIVDLSSQMDPVGSEKFTSTAMIRGICSRLVQLGYKIGGFDAYTTSNVLKGSGLSSSAAFEVLIVTILNHLYNNGSIDGILSAQISQYAENVYFGKPCGLMDQTACAVGGFVAIDFRDAGKPVVKKVEFDFAARGYTLVIVDTGGSHADLNEDYAAIPREMKEVAAAFGGKVLRDFSAEKVLGDVSRLRTMVNDRAILRALHFYGDDERVVKQVEALEKGDFDLFLRHVIESGRSSWTLLQNCYSCTNYKEQGVPIALAVSERILDGRGAWRVHGGGFAGTIQAFVPNSLLKEYVSGMQAIFGGSSCYELMIRPVGTVKVELV